ncbi:hypothetical protein XA68_11821 [Ophiocordyceps unilateralis]|uniref:N-acetyltransferase domain-containing protein n=1 Tax=Ophiocordyceps unilateralis TaxID=268505 RepID=A0A2A9PN63_OPHUN|nr:hypothetical protein XA68_11821 [Ophiocordyceps unilateralis]
MSSAEPRPPATSFPEPPPAAMSSPAQRSPPETPSSEPPPLSFELALTPDRRREALRLVADSIAQQRQVAALSIIFHPLCLAALVVGCSISWRHNGTDLGACLVAVSGLVMAYLAAIRLYTAPFLRLAEGFDCASFVSGPNGVQDVILVARFGDDIIGTLILRLPPSAAEVDMPAQGLIRAWTTRLRYRGKGVGADLLRYAVAATRAICGDTASLAFDPDHANAVYPLNRFFRRPFTVRDEKAIKALDHALRDCKANRGGFAPVDKAAVRKPVIL